MCGIGALLLSTPGELSGRLADRMGERMSHRGPDDDGWAALGPGGFRSGRGRVRCAAPVQAVLVHRRLSILDLSSGGHQPMMDPEGTCALALNGEIYNYIELRADLEHLGHSFKTASDTEVLLHAWLEWGSAALNRLVGMFSFVILDRARGILFAARDFFGMKPLYMCRWTGGLAFASEIKALLDLPGVSRVADPSRTRTFLASGIADYGGATLFRDVLQVPAGHYVRVAFDDVPERPASSRYWAPEVGRPVEISPDEAVRRVRDEFLSNVALHLRSDVPVGAALSGGIDSSAIVAAIRHLEPDREIHTFTHVVDDPVLGEERWADVIASATGARAHKVRPRPDDLVEDLDELTWFQDLPVQGTSAYAQYRVFRLAREAGITVLLDGQGADEILGGYPLFRAARLASLVRSGDGRAAVGLLRCLDGPGPRVNLARRALADYLVPRWITESARRRLGLEWRPAWIDEEWLSSRGARREAFHLGFGGTCVSAESVRCLTSLSLPDFLRFEDRNSMAHSRESRLPFLTPGFVNLALSLPGEYIVDERGVSKSIFRKAMRGIVPDAILDRRDKVGFATPESRWLTALRPWVEHVIAAPGSRIPALRLDALSARWRSVFEGRAPFDSTLWWALALIVWCRRFDVEFE